MATADTAWLSESPSKRADALCLAISVALFTAKLAVAVAIAGASLTPSPTMTTFLPAACNALTCSALSRGDSSPNAWFTCS